MLFLDYFVLKMMYIWDLSARPLPTNRDLCITHTGMVCQQSSSCVWTLGSAVSRLEVKLSKCCRVMTTKQTQHMTVFPAHFSLDCVRVHRRVNLFSASLPFGGILLFVSCFPCSTVKRHFFHTSLSGALSLPSFFPEFTPRAVKQASEATAAPCLTLHISVF